MLQNLITWCLIQGLCEKWSRVSSKGVSQYMVVQDYLVRLVKDADGRDAVVIKILVRYPRLAIEGVLPTDALAKQKIVS